MKHNGVVVHVTTLKSCPPAICGQKVRARYNLPRHIYILANISIELWSKHWNSENLRLPATCLPGIGLRLNSRYMPLAMFRCLIIH